MSVIKSEIRSGVYHDSVVLMQLQAALAELPGVLDAGAVMASETNLDLLEANGLRPPATAAVGAEDLLVVIKAESKEAATEALARVDETLARRTAHDGEGYRPKSLRAAVASHSEAAWVLVSVPGRYAAEVAREALELGRHVFLYSDNVPLDDEVELKRTAAAKGLMVMGPDCGTARLHGVGLGFANRVRGGAIGLVGASGTGLQAVMSHIHRLGAGVSQVFGTGGRDLDRAVAATTARQALDVLARDPATEVVVLISKPPAAAVASRLIATAEALGKPVVLHFLGVATPVARLGNVEITPHLSAAAARAVELLQEKRTAMSGAPDGAAPAVRPGFVRGLFSGGTLAYEALQGLATFLTPLTSNLSMAGVEPVQDAARSHGHTLLDLGSDEYTVGRPHPMIDQQLRLRRLRQEAEDPHVGWIVLDLVLGDGAHADPATELAPAIRAATERDVGVVAIVIGTDEDPQDLEAQIDSLRAAGAAVFTEVGAAVRFLHGAVEIEAGEALPAVDFPAAPLAAINVGLESFHHSLDAQGAASIHVEWRPPAGGNEKLQSILAKMRT